MDKPLNASLLFGANISFFFSILVSAKFTFGRYGSVDLRNLLQSVVEMGEGWKVLYAGAFNYALYPVNWVDGPRFQPIYFPS